MRVAALARPRLSVSVAAVGLGLCALVPARAATADDLHSQALSAEGDISTAITELNSASRLTGHAPAPYKRGDKRAFNALVGERGAEHGPDRTYAQNDNPASPAKDSRSAAEPLQLVMSATSSGAGSQS